jgi:formylglycine-generating enzyme required for sulfatase activity
LAEERANYLAQAALEAQQLAEAERKKNQEEAQQRELHQDGRREAELQAQQLAAQVAEAKREYEAARKEAAREAQLRAEAENKQKQIESELQSVASSEAERRKMVEARAKELIEEQAGRFEKEALAAKQRLDEARSLIELEANKREKAEAARIHAEVEAERLSQEIIEVQRQMEEMRQHVTADSGTGMNPNSMRNTGSSLTPLTQLSGAASTEIPSAFLNTGKISNKKPLLAAAAIGIISIFVLAGGGLGLYFMLGRSTVEPANDNINRGSDSPTPDGKSGEVVARKTVFIQGGTFLMGSNDIEDKYDADYGNEFPAHQEMLSSFNMDVYETTNAQYAEFVASGHKSPSYWANGKPPDGQENNPVTNVTLLDAKAYADWISKRENKVCRLPSEMEWEYAARNGSQNSTFPWGGQDLGDFAMLKGRDAVAVGTMGDKTLNDIYDMMGNVSEWTSTPFALYKGHPSNKRFDDLFAVRGLNFKTPDKLFKKPQLLLMYRQYLEENKDYDFLGFRLVCEP